nr:phosphomannose isomerase type II C-terminal cupin domain [Eubacterium maltosivorans]
MGNAVVSTSAENVNVINELEIPTVVIGAKNTVVVATHDGILVSDKDQSSNLKDYLGKNVLRPMCEKRQWGSYYILEHNEQKEGIQSVTKKLIIESGKNISYQYHQYRSEVWTVIGGMGIFILNNKIYPAKTGSVFKIKTGDKHTIRSIEKLTMIEVQLGTNLVEDDIIRIEKNWDKILLMCELSQYDN